MAEPSLGEITSIKGDPNLALGESGAFGQVVNPDYSVQYLATAANAKAQADKYIYEKFQDNLNNYLTNFNTVDTKGMLDNDYPDITKQWQKLAGDIADNYDVIRNPNRDLDKYSELKQREADLRGQIAQSQAQKLVVDQHNQFLNQHPTFATAENKQKILNFQQAPRDQRTGFTLDTPFNFDPISLSKAAGDRATQKLATATSDGKYITKEERIKILDDAYDEAWNAAASTQDSFGRTVRANAEDAYKRLPAEEQAQYPNFEDWFKSVGRGLRPQDQTTMASLDEDQYGVLGNQFKNNLALQDDDQKWKAWQNALDRDIARQKMAIDRDILKKGEVDVRAAGVLKNALLTQAFTTGSPDLQSMQQIYGDNTPITVKTGGGYVPDPTGAKDSKGNPLLVLGSTITEQRPKLQVIKTELTKDGKLKVYLRDNKTGKQLDQPLIRTLQDADVDFNAIAGKANAIGVADGSRKYLEEIGIKNVDLPKLQQYFNYQSPGAESYKLPNGQKKTRKELIDAGYTEDQIKQAIQSGKLVK